jgi:hypothetical protein
LIGSQSQRRVRIWQTQAVHRSTAGLILLVSGALFAIAISTFWMDRVAFTPTADTESTHAILQDEDIARQIAVLVASADAPELSRSPSELRDEIIGYTETLDMAAEMQTFTTAAHARVIGDRSAPVEIVATEQVQIVRNERVALLPPLRLPVERVGPLAIIASFTNWTWMITFGLAVLSLLIGLILRPERGEFSYAFSVGTVTTGALLVLFGYLIPAFVLASVSTDVWVGVLPQLATHRRGSTLVAGAAFTLVGVLAMFATNGARRRRQSSTPLSVGRFREQQRWSS